MLSCDDPDRIHKAFDDPRWWPQCRAGPTGHPFAANEAR